jgi:T5SS/PEP-CTERM-associated repeat protein
MINFMAREHGLPWSCGISSLGFRATVLARHDLRTIRRAVLAIMLAVPFAASIPANAQTAFRWSLVPTPTAPSPRISCAMAYDKDRGVTVLAGGDPIGNAFNDTWEFDGTTWTRNAAGDLPAPTTGASMAFDPVRHRMVLFGGGQSFQSVSQSTATYNFSAAAGGWRWTGAAVLSAPEMCNYWGTGTAWNPKGQGQMATFGGLCGSGDYSRLPFVLNSATNQWEVRNPLPGGTSVGRRSMGMCSFPGFPLPSAPNPGSIIPPGVLIINGTGPGGDFRQLLHFDGTAFADHTAPPIASRDCAAACDESTGRVVLYGGPGETTTQIYHNTVWNAPGVTGADFVIGGNPGPATRPGLVFDSAHNQFVLFGASPYTNGLGGGTWVLREVPPVIYVKANAAPGGDGSSWARAYQTLTSALADAASPSAAGGSIQIWVAKGTYTPAPPTAQGGQRTASFNLKNNLTIFGGFAGNETALSQRNITQNPTILSGDLNADDLGAAFPLNRDDNVLHVVTASAVGPSAVLDGFTISAGYARYSPDSQSSLDASGGGMVSLGASAIVRSCDFIDCNAFDGGGGVYHLPLPGASTPQFIDCVFQRCAAGVQGGALHAISNDPVIIRGCRFEGNRATGVSSAGGALSIQCPLVCADSTFVRNSSNGGSGGAIYATYNGSPPNLQAPRFENCQFVGNTTLQLPGASTGGGGAFWVDFGNLVMVNCLLAGNTALSVPAGGTGFDSSLELDNCSIVGNRSISALQTGLDCNGPTTIQNCILWDNTSLNAAAGEPLRVNYPDSSIVRHNTIQGWTNFSNNNSAANPLMARLPSPGPDNTWGTADDDYGNLRLTQGSPALDTGNNSAVPPDSADIDNDGNTTEYIPYDLDGSPRIQNNTVDRGCYEGFRCPTCPDDRQWFSPQSGTWGDDSRWSFSLPTFCHFATFDLPGTYAATFATGDQARGIDQSKGNVTLAGTLPASVLTLSPPAPGQSCPGTTPGIDRPSFRVSGGFADSPSLSITRGTVSARGGFIGDGYLERGSVSVSGIDAKLTFNLGAGLLLVGDSGEGNLAVTDGAKCFAGVVYLGQQDIDLDSPPDGVFDNHATLLVDGPGSALKPKFELVLSNAVATVRNSGLIDCGSFGRVILLNRSVLTGDGEIRGPVLNLGEVAPGDDARATPGPFTPSSLSITGPGGAGGGEFLQIGVDLKTGNQQSGTLRLRASGNGGAISTDTLQVNGSAQIAGTLVVEPIGTFSPATNAPAASLLSAAAVQGRFDLAVFPGLAGDRFMRLSYAGGLGERGAGISVSVAPLTQNIDLDPPSTANVGGVPTDIVAGDFDNDFTHDLDLALTVPDANNPTTAPGTVVILKNAGNTGPNGTWAGFTGGQLTFNVGVNPRGLAKGDFNADGVPDLAVANAGSNNLTVLRNLNNGTGAMTTNQTIAVGTSPVAVVTGVFRDSSSAIDVAVVNQGSNTVTILNNTAGTLAASATLNTGSAPSDITAAQLDPGSSTLDLAVTNRDDNTVTVYYRPPAAGFPAIPSRVLPVGPRPAAIEPGGLDNPKEINDLAVTNFGGGSTSILLNNQRPGVDAGFQPKADLPTGTNPDSITLGDLDNDGDPDLSVVTTVNAQRVVRVFRNDVQQVAPGEYQAAFAPFDDAYAGTDPRLVIAGDVNIDGRDDLIAVNDQSLVLRQAPGAAPGAEPQRVLIQQPNVSTSLSLAPNVPAPCPGDLVPAVGDNLVNTADLVAFLGQFGRTCTSLPQGTRCGDFNNDNLVNTTDLVAFLGRFGQPCP